MGLFDSIFRPKQATKSQEALQKANETFIALRGYKPVFHDWNGKIYESEIVRAAIDARARHISKLNVNIVGTAQPALQRKMMTSPNQWQTWSQFLYRLSTILDIHNTAFVVPVFDKSMVITGYYPVIPISAEVIQYKDELFLKYKFQHGETAAVELRKCAILTKHQYKNDFFGDEHNVLDDTMKLIHIQNEGIQEAIKNSASYRFIAQVNNFTKTEDLAKERKRFSEENLTKEAFVQILTVPENALLKQHKALLETEGADIEFTDGAVDEIANMAFLMNEQTENIGARRLHTIMEQLLEDISFNIPDMEDKHIVIRQHMRP